MSLIYQGLGIALSHVPENIGEEAFTDYTEPDMLDNPFVSPMIIEFDDIQETFNYFKKVIGIFPEVEKDAVKLTKEDLQKLDEFLRKQYVKNIKETIEPLQKALQDPSKNAVVSLAYTVKNNIAYMQPAIAFVEDEEKADLGFLSAYPYYEIKKMKAPVYAKTFFWEREV